MPVQWRKIFWDSGRGRLTPWTIPRHLEVYQQYMNLWGVGMTPAQIQEIEDFYRKEEAAYYEREGVADYVSIFDPIEEVEDDFVEERRKELKALSAQKQKDLIAELGIETDATNAEGRIEAILAAEFPTE